MAKRFLKAANSLISFVVVLCLLITGAYASYALWDNNQIYAAAQNVQDELLSLKPKPEEREDPALAFARLQKVNPDVCAWITLDNTHIDYPILQGSDNLAYINTDVHGEFSLTGSIFLDVDNARDFTDLYNVLYGHHVAEGHMFGDLDLYKDKAFFDENTTGTLLLPDRSYQLRIFACMLVAAQDRLIFEPNVSGNDLTALLDYAEAEALHLHPETLQSLRDGRFTQVLAFTTCSTEFSDARTIVLAVMEPGSAAAQEA